MIGRTIAMVCALTVAGCAPKLGGSDYQASEVGAMSKSKIGTIVSMRVVQIHAKQPNEPGTGIGALGGAVAGGVVGHQFGGGRGQDLATVAGIVGGATAGHFAEQAITGQEGYEYTVRLEGSKDMVTVTQGAEPRMSVGQRVIVIDSSGTDGKARSRIIPA